MSNSTFLLRTFLLIGALMTCLMSNASTTDFAVKFVRIDIDQIGNDVEIKWLTNSEYNLDYFMVQRSLNGGANWQSLGTVQSSGITPGSDTYNFTDTQAPAGTVIYRIRETDFDEVSSYSFEVSINVTFFINDNEYELQVYPNPAEDEVVLESDEFSETTIVEMMDISGKLILADVDRNDRQITVKPFNKLFGLYFLMITNEENTIVKKIKFE